MTNLILIGVVLVVVVVLEVVFFSRSAGSLRRLRSLMEYKGLKYPDQSWMIYVDDRMPNGEMPSLIASVNDYLKSAGGHGDFSIIRDIVNRYVEQQEDEAHGRIMMPLYVGLCGTLAGVVIGLIIFSQDAEDFTPMLLDTGLAIAGCLVGLVLTIVASRGFGHAKSANDLNKNDLLTKLATGNRSFTTAGAAPVAAAPVRVELGDFNSQFAQVAEGLKASLDAIREVAQNQTALTEAVNAIKALPIVTVKAESDNMNLAIGLADSSVSHAIIDLQASVDASMEQLKMESVERCSAIEKLIAEESSVVGNRAKELTSLTASVSTAAQQISDLQKRMDSATQAMEKAAAAVESLTQAVTSGASTSLWGKVFKH